MKPILRAVSVILLLSGPVAGESADLLMQTRPDAGIAMIHFPKSLAVLRHRRAGSESASGFEDPAPVRRTLKKTDPARLVPSRLGPDLTGPLTREALAKAARSTGADLLLVYRPGNIPEGGVRVRGLVYFAKQQKIAPLPPGEAPGEASPQAAYEAALRQLAASARKTILSYQFEKRRSNY